MHSSVFKVITTAPFRPQGGKTAIVAREVTAR